MTRVTNFGIKRTYLEAGLSNDETPNKEIALVEPSTAGIHDPATQPPKKKRKRTPKSKRDGNLGKDVAESKGEARENDLLKKDTKEDLGQSSTTAQAATGKSAKRNKRNKERRKNGKSFPKHSFVIDIWAQTYSLFSDF